VTVRLSVCIANYQGEAVIARCLDSVLSQSCDFEFEVLVHDDASRDGSCDIIKAGYPGVELLRSSINQGFCKSNNTLVEQARSEYVLLLNNDTRLHPGSLKALMDCANSDPDAGVLSLPQFDMGSGELLDRGMFLDIFANPIPNLQPAAEVATVMGSCLWMRRELWEEIGGFPDWFGSMAEDMYLCARVRLMGRRVRVIDRGGYDHVVGHTFGGGKVAGNRLETSYRRRRLSELNKNRVIALCFPPPTNLLVLGVQFMLLLGEGLLLSVLKRSVRPLAEIYLPSIAGILGDIPRLWRVQRQVAGTRKVGLKQFYGPIRFRHHKLTLLRRHGVPSVS
jgi:GT2 family glycosyltransferase